MAVADATALQKEMTPMGIEQHRSRLEKTLGFEIRTTTGATFDARLAKLLGLWDRATNEQRDQLLAVFERMATTGALSILDGNS